MKRSQGSCIGAFLVLLVAGCSMIFIVPFGGSMVAANSTLFNKLTAYVLCPDAVDYSYSDYGFGQPTTSSPSGGTGHYTELTCTFSDGSQITHPNEEVGIKGLGAAFTAVGICGGMLVLFLMVVGAVIGGMVIKPKTKYISKKRLRPCAVNRTGTFDYSEETFTKPNQSSAERGSGCLSNNV